MTETYKLRITDEESQREANKFTAAFFSARRWARAWKRLASELSMFDKEKAATRILKDGQRIAELEKALWLFAKQLDCGMLGCDNPRLQSEFCPDGCVIRHAQEVLNAD